MKFQDFLIFILFSLFPFILFISCVGGNPSYLFSNPKIDIVKTYVDSDDHLVLNIDLKNTSNDDIAVDYLEVDIGGDNTQNVNINKTIKAGNKINITVSSKSNIGIVLRSFIRTNSNNKIKVAFRVYNGKNCLNWINAYIR